MKKKNYAAAIVAVKIKTAYIGDIINVVTQVGGHVAFITASSFEEAKKLAVGMAHENYSTNDGWSDQSAAVEEITPEWMANNA